jgi:hypothetical protein
MKRYTIRIGRLVGAVALLLACVGPAAANTIYWADWAPGDTCTGNCFTASGTITTPTSTVNVTYTNPNGVGFYQTGAAGEQDWWAQRPLLNRNPATSPYTSAQVDNIPTGTDIIGLQFAGQQTLTFSEAIANPVFSFVSLNANGYAFLNQDFNILSLGGVDGNDCGWWGCGGARKNVVNLPGGDVEYQLIATNVGGTEPHGTIQFTGAFGTLTWRSLTNEYWNGFTVGVQGTAAEVFPPGGTTVPEPATLTLVGLGIAGLLSRRGRGRSKG